MSNLKIGIIVLFLCLGVLGCGKDGNNSPQVPPHSERDFDQSFIPISMKGKKINAANMQAEALSEVLACEESSLYTRLDTQKYKVVYSKVDRRKDSLELPVTVRGEKLTYDTDSDGQLYTNAYQLVELSLGGQSALSSGAYAYTDSCTLASGCDKEKREYTTGNAWTKVQAETRMQQMISDAHLETTSYNCSYTLNPDITPLPATITNVQVSLFGQIRNASEYRDEQSVIVTCQGEEVGEGTIVKREVILADQLPGLHEFATTKIGDKSIGCTRTKVFEGSQVRFSGRTTLSGHAREVTFYSVEGEIQSPEAWDEFKNKKKALKKAVDEAKTSVSKAQSDRDDASHEVTKKRRELSQAKEEEQLAKNLLDQLKDNPDSTPVDIKTAEDDYLNKRVRVQQIQVTLEDARDALETAQISLDSAKARLRNAEAALATYLEESESKS